MNSENPPSQDIYGESLEPADRPNSPTLDTLLSPPQVLESALGSSTEVIILEEATGCDRQLLSPQNLGPPITETPSLGNARSLLQISPLSQGNPLFEANLDHPYLDEQNPHQPDVDPPRLPTENPDPHTLDPQNPPSQTLHHGVFNQQNPDPKNMAMENLPQQVNLDPEQLGIKNLDHQETFDQENLAMESRDQPSRHQESIGTENLTANLTVNLNQTSLHSVDLDQANSNGNHPNQDHLLQDLSPMDGESQNLQGQDLDPENLDPEDLGSAYQGEEYQPKDLDSEDLDPEDLDAEYQGEQDLDPEDLDPEDHGEEYQGEEYQDDLDGELMDSPEENSNRSANKRKRCNRNRKRSARRKIFCPLHGCYLDSSSPKYPLYASQPGQLQERGMGRQSSSLVLATYGTVPLKGEWLECFWCKACKRVEWYHVRLQNNTYSLSVAPPELWQSASGVIHPHGNPSVGEFTKRTARMVGVHGTKVYRFM